MNIPKFTEDVNAHQNLPDEPSLTAEELKKAWDKPVNDIKKYINETLLEKLKDFEQEIQTKVNELRPVGSIYISAGNENPNNLWQGTVWEQIKDRFLLSSGNKSLGKIGGEENHTLTEAEMPIHTHDQEYHNHPYSDATLGVTYSGNYRALTDAYGKTTEFGMTDSVKAVNKNTGGGQAHNNMPPYLVVNVWKRIS